MKAYSLATLLKLRERHKEAAEHSLHQALSVHVQEQNKLNSLQTELTHVLLQRKKLQSDFFERARFSPINKREIVCHSSSHQKSMHQEALLKQSVESQKIHVRTASVEVENAHSKLILAHQELRILEKHQSHWQQSQKRAEQHKEEIECDDRNQACFRLKKG